MSDTDDFVQHLTRTYDIENRLNTVEQRMVRVETKLENVATKTDIADLKTHIAEGQKDQLKWLIRVIGVAAISLVVALVRTFWGMGST